VGVNPFYGIFLRPLREEFDPLRSGFTFRPVSLAYAIFNPLCAGFLRELFVNRRSTLIDQLTSSQP